MHSVSRPEVLAAWDVYRQFADKQWSFTDCVSKVLMARRGIQTAFAFDAHFRQFGSATAVPLSWKSLPTRQPKQAVGDSGQPQGHPLHPLHLVNGRLRSTWCGLSMGWAASRPRTSSCSQVSPPPSGRCQ